MNHSSEKEIQEYALDQSSVPAYSSSHIESCPHCMEAVGNYRFLFSDIGNLETPAFDFDLPALVMEKIAVKKPGVSTDQFIAAFLVIFAFACVGFPVFLFGQYLLNMFTSIPSFFIYATTICTAVILAFKILEMYRKYIRQMRYLNFR